MIILIQSQNKTINTDHIIRCEFSPAHHQDAGQDEDGAYPARDYDNELTIYLDELTLDESYEWDGGAVQGVTPVSRCMVMRGQDALAFWNAYIGLPGTITLPVPQPAQVDHGSVNFQGTIYTLQEDPHPSSRWISDNHDLPAGTHYTAEYSANANKEGGGASVYVVYFQFDAVVGEGTLPLTMPLPVDLFVVDVRLLTL